MSQRIYRPESFLEDLLRLEGAVVPPLRDAAANLERELKKAQRRLAEAKFAATAITDLRIGEQQTGFGSWSHWLFVADFRLSAATPRDPNGLRELASLSCLVVPEVLCDHEVRIGGHFQHLNRQQIAARLVGHYGSSKVRLGTLDEVLRAGCSRCGLPAVTVCRDSWDGDDGGHGGFLDIFRLCTDCAWCQQLAETYAEILSETEQLWTTKPIFDDH